MNHTLQSNIIKVYGYWTSKYGWGVMVLTRDRFKQIKFKPENSSYNIIINKTLNNKYFL